ncbi:MAG: hypothetical protein HY675_21115 [Chloroflexi bacterium]|nr:hypothetical protein [Chloroflexota bacterium]
MIELVQNQALVDTAGESMRTGIKSNEIPLRQVNIEGEARADLLPAAALTPPKLHTSLCQAKVDGIMVHGIVITTIEDCATLGRSAAWGQDSQVHRDLATGPVGRRRYQNGAFLGRRFWPPSGQVVPIGAILDAPVAGDDLPLAVPKRGKAPKSQAATEIVVKG